MRKVILLAALILIAALLLMLSRLLGSHAPVSTLPPETVDAPTLSSPSKPGDITEVDRTPVERTTPGTPNSDRGGNDTSTLRIHLSFAHDANYVPRDLRVRVSDLLGVQRDAHFAAPLEYIVPGLIPGDYVVAVNEAMSIGTTRRAHVEKGRSESSVEIELERKTSLSVRWRTPDGHSIESALPDAELGERELTLSVCATEHPIDPRGPRPAVLQIAEAHEDLRLLRDAESDRLVVHKVEDGRPEDSASRPNPEADMFAHLDVPSHPPFVVSAWIAGVLMDAQTVGEGQREVVFTTNLSAVGQSRVPVSCCFVDDVTGAPVENVRMSVNQSRGAESRTKDNCGTLEIDPGWTLIKFDIDFSSSFHTERAQYAPLTLEVHAFAGQPIDLGTLRLAPARAARLRVVDAAGAPVDAAEITLVRLSTYDGTQAPFDLQRGWSKADGIVTFPRVLRERYVAACTSPRLDSNPVVFDGSTAPEGADSIVGTIVVRPARQISLVFDDPPRAGTLMMIETPDGLPVRTLEMDEFGIVPLWLGGNQYRVHLVEDGEPTVSVPLEVTSDPFIQRIKR